jgi:hypothetical protein
MNLIGQHRVSMSMRNVVKLLAKEIAATGGTQDQANAKPEGFIASVQPLRNLFEYLEISY